MSFHEMVVTVRAVNRASHEFSRISADAVSMEARIRSVASTVAGLGAGGVAVAHLAHQFGILNDQQAKTVSSAMSVVTVIGMFLRTSWGMAIAQKIYAIATGVATGATWAFNAALAAKIVLLTLGVGAVVVAAAAMASLAMQTQAAAGAMRDYNAVVSETPGHTRGIVRAGEEEESALLRRGID